MSEAKFSFEEDDDEEGEVENEDGIQVVEDFDRELSENVAEDLIEYSRSEIIKNEEQFLLVFYGYTTGFMESPNNFVSGCIIGTSSSGKTHLQGKVEKLFPQTYMYEATTGSEKSIIYDSSWENAHIAALDELQKPSDTIIEILKSLHGDDEEFRYKVTGDGEGKDRDVDEIVRTAIPYWFLYAQHDPDFEMWSRLLKIPVHESASKNRGVIRHNWGHEGIEFDDDTDVDYISESHDLRCALQQHVLDMPKNAHVKIPAGEEEFGGWDAIEHVEDIFDASMSQTNRSSNMVANLVRASALNNYENRDTEEIYIDDEDTYKEHIIAEPQDVANVISCRKTLLATTHEIDRKKIAVCTAIEERSGTGNKASINDIKDYLNERDAPKLQRTEIINMLSELRENYLVEKHENEGQNGRNLYRFLGWENLGYISVTERFREVFENCKNPITGENFVDYVERQNEDLLPTADDFDDFDDVSAGNAQSRIGGDGDKSYKMRPHVVRTLENLYEFNGDERVYENAEETTIEDMLGIGENHDETIMSAEHDVWSQKGKPEDWVSDNQTAVNEIDDVMRELYQENLFETELMESDENGEVKKIYVKNPEELDMEETDRISDNIVVR
jgi:hypothetical protein